MAGERRRTQPSVPLQPSAVLGRGADAFASHHQAGAEQPGGRGLDRYLETPLRTSRHAGTIEDWPYGVARVRAADQLGRRTPRRSRGAGDAGAFRRISDVTRGRLVAL